MSLWYQIEKEITAHTGQAFKIAQQQEIGGGCINSAFKISNEETSWFVKTNKASLADMFAAEAESLNEMAASETVKVPQALCHGRYGDNSYLVLEYLPLGGAPDMEKLGAQLAEMHQQTATQFGWHRNNVIGSTTQINAQKNNWVEFWREERLGFQLQLAKQNGCSAELLKQGERLTDCLDEFFEDYQPLASMLHGDLWGGNVAGLKGGTPVIFDPAFYYGDRETDIAMTTLFGGYSPAFYQAYNEVWPLDAGYQHRKTLYNVYHIINHFNLFGGGYESQAISMIQRVMSRP